MPERLGQNNIEQKQNEPQLSKGLSSSLPPMSKTLTGVNNKRPKNTPELDPVVEKLKQQDFLEGIKNSDPDTYAQLEKILKDDPDAIKNFNTPIITKSILEIFISENLKETKEVVEETKEVVEETKEVVEETNEVVEETTEVAEEKSKLEGEMARIDKEEVELTNQETEIFFGNFKSNSEIFNKILGESKVNSILRLIDSAEPGLENRKIIDKIHELFSQGTNLEKVAAEIQKSGTPEDMQNFRGLIEGLGDQSLIQRLNNFENAPKAKGMAKMPDMPAARAVADAQIAGPSTKLREVENVIISEDGDKNAIVDKNTGDRWLSVDGCNYQISTETDPVGEFYYAETTEGIDYEKSKAEVQELNEQIDTGAKQESEVSDSIIIAGESIAKSPEPASEATSEQVSDSLDALFTVVEDTFKPIEDFLKKNQNESGVSSLLAEMSNLKSMINSDSLNAMTGDIDSSKISKYKNNAQDLVQKAQGIADGIYAKKKQELEEQADELQNENKKQKEEYQEALTLSMQARRENNEARDQRVFDMLEFFGEIGLDAIDQGQLQKIIDAINTKRSSGAISQAGINADINLSDGSVGVEDFAKATFDQVEKVSFLKLINVIATGKTDGENAIFANPDVFAGGAQKLPRNQMRDALMRAGVMNEGGGINFGAVMRNLGGAQGAEQPKQKVEKQ